MSRRVEPRADLESIRELDSIIRRIRPDIVHAHTPKGGLLGMIAATSCRVPLRIYHLRGMPLLTARGPMRRVLWATESISCSAAHRVLAVSESLADAAREAGIVGARKAKVLAHGSGNGVDSTRFDPSRVDRAAARAALGLRDDEIVITYVGRLVRDKGISELLAAWRELRGRWPHARLLVVGPFEERDAIAADEVEAIRHDPSIRHVEFTEDMPSVYRASDLVVLPSHREGFPNVPLEAACMELPVITTDAVGCRDSVVDGVTGRIVRLGDVEALGRAMEGYLASPTSRREHGAAGRARATTDFRPRVIWDALRREYGR
jgi:glycosyltransferase involved in cell wall biosynthesis